MRASARNRSPVAVVECDLRSALSTNIDPLALDASRCPDIVPRPLASVVADHGRTLNIDYPIAMADASWCVADALGSHSSLLGLARGLATSCGPLPPLILARRPQLTGDVGACADQYRFALCRVHGSNPTASVLLAQSCCIAQ